MRREPVRLLKTLEHPCGYYPQRLAQNLVIDPLAAELPRIYGQAIAYGFRRAGGHVYRPACVGCWACVPTRIPVARFAPDRAQRRNLRRNADLSVTLAEPRADDEIYALYRRYVATRHPGGGMDDGDAEDFERFLAQPWPGTRFLELRAGSRLVAVAVTDVVPDAWSAVYTFYDPAEAARGLGTFAILSQVAGARADGRAYLYLGYWIEGHPKMDYKRRFRPLERFAGSGWLPLA